MANINSQNINKAEEALQLAYKDLISFGKLFLPDDFMRSETPFFHYEISDAIVKINSLIKLGQSDSYVNTLVLENQSLFIEWNDFVLDGKYLISIGKDVTKEYTLNQQNERLSLVAKSVTNGVVITDESGFILWINESFGNLFDSVFDEVIGQNISELYCKGEVDNDTFQGNLYASFEFKFKSDNTISRWVLLWRWIWS